MAAKNRTGSGNRGPGQRFGKGRSGNPKGRPRGRQNRATRDARAFAVFVLEDSQVQARMLADARKGRLAPAVMVLLFHYAYGKPKERIEATVVEELRFTITDDIGNEPTSAPAPVSTTASPSETDTVVPFEGRSA